MPDPIFTSNPLEGYGTLNNQGAWLQFNARNPNEPMLQANGDYNPDAFMHPEDGGTGWKMHISAKTPEAIRQLADLAAEYKIPAFKLAISEERLEQFQDSSRGQAGKAAVFYYSENGVDGKPIDWKGFAQKAQNVLDRNGGAGADVQRDKALPGSDGIFYRHGQDAEGNYLERKGITEFMRARDIPSAMSYNIGNREDPFADISIKSGAANVPGYDKIPKDWTVERSKTRGEDFIRRTVGSEDEAKAMVAELKEQGIEAKMRPKGQRLFVEINPESEDAFRELQAKQAANADTAVAPKKPSLPEATPDEFAAYVKRKAAEKAAREAGIPPENPIIDSLQPVSREEALAYIDRKMAERKQAAGQSGEMKPEDGAKPTSPSSAEITDEMMGTPRYGRDGLEWNKPKYPPYLQAKEELLAALKASDENAYNAAKARMAEAEADLAPARMAKLQALTTDGVKNYGLGSGGPDYSDASYKAEMEKLQGQIESRAAKIAAVPSVAADAPSEKLQDYEVRDTNGGWKQYAFQPEESPAIRFVDTDKAMVVSVSSPAAMQKLTNLAAESNLPLFRVEDGKATFFFADLNNNADPVNWKEFTQKAKAIVAETSTDADKAISYRGVDGAKNPFTADRDVTPRTDIDIDKQLSDLARSAGITPEMQAQFRRATGLQPAEIKTEIPPTPVAPVADTPNPTAPSMSTADAPAAATDGTAPKPNTTNNLPDRGSSTRANVVTGASSSTIGLAMSAYGLKNSIEQGDSTGIAVASGNLATAAADTAADVSSALGRTVSEGAKGILKKANIVATVADGIYQIANEQEGYKGQRTAAVAATTATSIAASAVGTALAATATGATATVAAIAAPITLAVGAAVGVGYLGNEIIDTNKNRDYVDKQFRVTERYQNATGAWLDDDIMARMDKAGGKRTLVAGGMYSEKGEYYDLVDPSNVQKLKQAIAAEKAEYKDTMDKNETSVPRLLMITDAQKKAYNTYENAEWNYRRVDSADKELDAYLVTNVAKDFNEKNRPALIAALEENKQFLRPGTKPEDLVPMLNTGDAIQAMQLPKDATPEQIAEKLEKYAPIARENEKKLEALKTELSLINERKAIAAQEMQATADPMAEKLKEFQKTDEYKFAQFKIGNLERGIEGTRAAEQKLGKNVDIDEKMEQTLLETRGDLLKKQEEFLATGSITRNSFSPAILEPLKPADKQKPAAGNGIDEANMAMAPKQEEKNTSSPMISEGNTVISRAEDKGEPSKRKEDLAAALEKGGFFINMSKMVSDAVNVVNERSGLLVAGTASDGTVRKSSTNTPT